MAANRTKTIEYMLPMLSTAATYQAEGTAYLDSADTTIYIPETTSRTFKSVAMEVVIADNHASVGADLSAFSVRGSCDGGSNWTTKTRASGYADSGENMSHGFIVDMTAEFTARFSGTSNTFRWGFYMDYSTTGPTLANASAKLMITYEYDDTTHSTRIKTVRIPIESFNGRLSNSAQEVKQTSTTANQLPALKHASTPFLPEASVTIRQAFCELWTNNLPSSTGDASLILKIDSGGSETTFGVLESGNTSPITVRYLYDVTAVDWTSAHALYARHDVASQSHYTHLGGWLTVTYEYDHSSTSTVLNSVLMGLGETTLNTLTTGNDDTFSVERYIEEPATVTMVQSGVWITCQTSASSTTLNFKIGSQASYTGYTPTGATTMAGMLSIVHRFDSGSNGGSGISLSRGVNTFTAQFYAANVDRIGNLSAMMILNYTSGKYSGGDGAHAHSVHYILYDSTTAAATTNVQFSTLYTPEIIESNYWLMSVMPIFYATGITGATEYYCLQTEKESEAGSGWADVFLSMTIGGNERLFTISNAVVRSLFKRWPNDTDSSRMNIETSRAWRWYGTSCIIGLATWITYHSMTYTIAGTVSGYTGDGSGLTVVYHRSSDGMYLGSSTTTSGGAHTFTWYGNSTNIFAACRQDSTHMGRSDDDVGV